MGDATTYKKLLCYGTYDHYVALETKDPDVLYFCTDNGKIFKGEIDFTNNFVAGTASQTPSAANAVPGLIYYETDTRKFLTKIGDALVEIGNPLDAVGDGTTTTITAQSADSEVPSSYNVWLYGQEILSQATGGSAVVKNISADSTDGGIVVTYGDNSTSQVIVPGVITGLSAGQGAGDIDITLTDGTSAVSIDVGVTGIAADQTTDAQLIVSNGDATSTVLLNGVVTTPTWDETSLKLILPVSGGTNVEVNIPKDIFLESGSYDSTNKKIILTLNDASSTTIEFSVSDLIPIYEAADTSTIATSFTWDSTNGKYILTADAKISDATTNVLTYDGTGLLVDGSQFVTTSDFTVLESTVNNLAEAALQWGTF